MPTAIDLFCGAGGLSLGLRHSGFNVLAGIDNFDAAGKTFEATHPGCKFFCRNIEDVHAREILETLSLEVGELDCLAGGPPCQAFSVYNHKRGLDDRRAGLFREYLRLVEELKPKWVLMENVMGILSIGGGTAVKAIIAGLNELGYDVEYRILRAEEFGVPQERRRVVFLGNRLGQSIIWPKPTHGEDLRPYTTVYDAIGDLPVLANGESSEGRSYVTQPTSDFQATVRQGDGGVTNHHAPRLSKMNLERMRHIPPGGSWRDIPHDLLPAGMKKARRCDHTKRYGRLDWDGLSSTILTKCDIHWGAYIHPVNNRSLTVREAARLQSFPDNFEFLGSKTEQFIQVGNAVPPMLATALGKEIVKSLSTYSEKTLSIAA